MNRLTIIGNLTRDPELRTTQDGKNVCTFTVAVNRRGREGADYFRVSAWNAMGENCHKYLAKGRKVAVCGTIGAHAYTAQDGSARASLEVMAQDVEFLTPRNQGESGESQDGYTLVDGEDMPF